MNTNQEIKDLVKSIKTHRRGKIPYHTNYWFTSGTSTHIVKYVIPIQNSRKESKFKKILVSLFSIFNIFTIHK
jgi:hypothetical protein